MINFSYTFCPFSRIFKKGVCQKTSYSDQEVLNFSKGEVKLIDYQLQQYRILPQLANAFVFWFAAKKIRQTYQNMQNDIVNGKVRQKNNKFANTKVLIAKIQ